MNASSTNQPHITINTFKQSKTKKKSLPISINSNIAPGSFLFNNKVSKIATSYKNIGDQINTYEKLKQLNQKAKVQSNVLMINNFFSVNSLSSKNSQMSNNSILNKNNSNVMSSRFNPSNVLFNKTNLINNLTGYATCTSNRCAKFKTLSKDKHNDANSQNTQRNMKLKAVKQIRRQKSIVGLVPSSKGNKMISFKGNHHTNSIMNADNHHVRNYNMSVIVNNNHTSDKASSANTQNICVNVNNNNNNKTFNTIKSEGNSVRNKSERSTVKNCVVTKVCKTRSVSLKHNKQHNNKKSFRKTIHTETIDVDNTNTNTDKNYEKACNILSVPSQSCKNKNVPTMTKNGNVLTTYSAFNTSNTIGNLNNNTNITHIKTIKVETGSRKRRLSHGSISLTKETQLNQNEVVSHHRNNNSISINRLALNKFIINNNNEKKQQQQQQQKHNGAQHNINTNETNADNTNNNDVQTQPQIKINLNPLFQDIKVSSTSRAKQTIPLEKVQVNRKQKSQSKANKNTQIKHKQEQLFRNNNQTNTNNIILETNKLSSVDNNSTNNHNNIFNRNLFENDNIIYDDAPFPDDPFDNLNDVVRRLNFKSISTTQANIFSTENNCRYDSYQGYFDVEFDKKVKSKHSLTTTNITSANKALSTGNKSSERKSFHNVSMSTQDNSNKKYLSSPIHRISYCN